MLRVQGLSKSYYHGVPVLHDVSFSLDPRTFTAILGLSGAGKSTLLRCIPRLVRPSTGHIWFDGQDLACCSYRTLSAARAAISLVSQNVTLVGRRTAVVNCLAGRLRELSLWRIVVGRYPRSLLVEAMAALNRVRLLDEAFRRADSLSGGQQQRVAIARALTQHARLLLADEPVASLDPENAALVLDLLRGLCQERQLTVLCNLHQVDLARRFADRIIGLREGRVVFDGPVAAFDANAERQIYRNEPAGSDEEVAAEPVLHSVLRDGSKRERCKHHADL